MSTPIITRLDFQLLAEARLEEARILLDQGKWDGAYYLSGYAVELGLKSCIIRMLMATDAFPASTFSRDCYTHDIKQLLELAKLGSEWNAESAIDQILLDNWNTATEWSEKKRYNRISEDEARSLYNAIADNMYGVMPWIRTRW